MLNRWLIIGAVGLLLLAGIAVQTARLDASQEREKTALKAAADNAAAVKQLQADAALATRLVAQYAAEIAALQETYRNDQIAILRAPSRRCLDDPACRVALERMRARRGTSQGSATNASGGTSGAMPADASGARP